MKNCSAIFIGIFGHVQHNTHYYLFIIQHIYPFFSFITLNRYLSPAVLVQCVFCSLRTYSRSSHQICSIKKRIFNIFLNSQENTCVGVPFLIKLQASLQAFSFIKKRLQHRFFPVDFAKFLKASFKKNPPDDYFYTELFQLRKSTLKPKSQFSFKD